MRPLLILLALLPLVPSPAHAQEDRFKDVVIERTELGGGLYMLTGAGGNMALLTGPEGAVLVDDQFAPLTERIVASVKEVTDQPVQWVINTHWHGDHTGGNENLGKAGAHIVAHRHVRDRMSTQQVMEAFGRTVPPAPADALPVLTFSEELDLHWNGAHLRAHHVPNAHTDGDALIHFADHDVLHMGDLFFNGFYPFIDTGRRGSLAGMIAGAQAGLAIATDTTKIIPGHGPLADTAALQRYLTMLEAARDAIQPLADQGLSKEEIVAKKPTAALDAVWGQGFLKPDVWVGIVVDGIRSGD